MNERYCLQYKAKLSRKQAADKIFAHASYGKHIIGFRPATRRDLDTYYLQRGISPAALIEECRDPKRVVPEFQNMIGTTWDTSGGFSIIESDGTVLGEAKGPSKLVLSTYEDHFYAACGGDSGSDLTLLTSASSSCGP